MNNFALKVAYDGTNYFGWQKNLVGPSVEEEIQKVLEKILQHPVILQAASRTDAGVHSKGQIVNFFTAKEIDDSLFRYSLNALLPEDIQVLLAKKMDPSFHPTLDCIKKMYTYQVSFEEVLLPFDRRTTWHVPTITDIPSMKKACSFFEGIHDFSSFCNKKKNEIYEHHIREVFSVKVKEEKEKQLIFTVQGKRFLYKMVRNIVGTLVDIGRKKIPLQKLDSIFISKDRKKAGITAPAHGLTLEKVVYANDLFSFPKNDKEKNQKEN